MVSTCGAREPDRALRGPSPRTRRRRSFSRRPRPCGTLETQGKVAIGETLDYEREYRKKYFAFHALSPWMGVGIDNGVLRRVQCSEPYRTVRVW